MKIYILSNIYDNNNFKKTLNTFIDYADTAYVTVSAFDKDESLSAGKNDFLGIENSICVQSLTGKHYVDIIFSINTKSKELLNYYTGEESKIRLRNFGLFHNEYRFYEVGDGMQAALMPNDDFIEKIDNRVFNLFEQVEIQIQDINYLKKKDRSIQYYSQHTELILSCKEAFK